MATMNKRTPVAVVTVNGSRITWTWADGYTRTVDVEQLDPAIVARAALHGIEQKGRDSYALPTVDGKRPTLAEKKAEFDAVIDRLHKGEWNAPRGEGGGSGGLLFAAMVEAGYKFADVDAFRTWIAKMAEKQATSERKVRDALAANPKIEPIIARLRAERGTEDAIDSDDLLSQIPD